MSSEGSSTPEAVKSRQERIRDNQRRSRARRQKYVADLERRLEECHATSREADLQLAAFADLEAQNARLLELLTDMGASAELVDAYRHGTPQHPAYMGNAPFRRIKPRLRSLPSLGQHGPDGGRRDSAASPTYLGNCNAQGTTGPPTRILSLDTADTLYSHREGDSVPDNGNSVPYSAAVEMIQQYRPPPEDMARILGRLVAGGRVDSRVVQQILGELDKRQLPVFQTPADWLFWPSYSWQGES